jgi:hypothetical protein
VSWLIEEQPKVKTNHSKFTHLTNIDFIQVTSPSFSSLDLPTSPFPKTPLCKYPFLHKQSGQGFLLIYLGHEESFKRNDLLRVEGDPRHKPAKINPES